MAIQLEFTYSIKDSTVNTTHNVPETAEVGGGSCGNTTQRIDINSTDCAFSLTFAKDGNNFQLTNMSFIIYSTSLPGYNGSDLLLEFNNKTFNTPLEHSYYCTRTQTLIGYETPSMVTPAVPAKIIVSHVQLEAFHANGKASFSTAKDCDAPETPDIIPIAVGIALAALIVVVLIAYLVARRRQQTGYMSM